MTTRRMTYDELEAMPDDGFLHELVRGEIRRVPPPKEPHGDIEAALVEAISRYLYDRAVALGWDESQGRAARKRLVGQVSSGEAGIRFRLKDDPDQVRGVGVLYLTPDQYRRCAAALRDDYIPEVPALCIEIVSPSHTANDVDEKVTDYLSGGAEIVWVLYPRTRTVKVMTPDNVTRTIPAAEVLEGGEVLPGFVLPLTGLFK
jgi:Uma2 family endonuclease